MKVQWLNHVCESQVIGNHHMLCTFKYLEITRGLSEICIYWLVCLLVGCKNLMRGKQKGTRISAGNLLKDNILLSHFIQEALAQADAHIHAQSQPRPQVDPSELVPRLCHLVRTETGYGFNLHSERSRPGQYIRSLDPGSPADGAGLRPQDRLIEVRRKGVDEGSVRCWGACHFFTLSGNVFHSDGNKHKYAIQIWDASEC